MENQLINNVARLHNTPPHNVSITDTIKSHSLNIKCIVKSNVANVLFVSLLIAPTLIDFTDFKLSYKIGNYIFVHGQLTSDLDWEDHNDITEILTKIPDNTEPGFGYIEITAQGVDLGTYTGRFAYYNNVPYKISDNQLLPLIQAPNSDPLPTGTVTWRQNIAIDTNFSTKSQVRFFDSIRDTRLAT